ncbi:origin recognition complex subunit 5 C-terminus-domain-containing protein [Epithele typhae]|uniref:origin recognition complex subunit 5 C-terminus-domain-containing protein n=1 Tax=Epithele typhae TaxID=378194 RepID=UPI0020072FFB|nr:origin recognition complex subunit 5 C-terminus-domain-containing protein [Epithele typhae]KAH9919470.1 origin recognition complex subunit 5 C-terminus-domain-containing protein [Epithele typhae]
MAPCLLLSSRHSQHSYPPPFVFVHDPDNPRLTAARPLESTQLRYACVNAVACFTPRLLFDTALNALAGWVPDWHTGAQNWLGAGDGEGRGGGDVGKGKTRASEHAHPARMVLMVERAERLKDSLPDLLSHVDIITIFVSDVQWQDIRPPMRAAPEPYYLDVPSLSKESTQELLADCYPSLSDHPSSSKQIDHRVFDPVFQPLYHRFVATLHNVCSLFVRDPLELAYIASARWPNRLRRRLGTPTEDAILRLTRLFAPSLTAALDALYPRLSTAAHWARAHTPPPNLLALHPRRAPDALAAHAATLAASSAGGPGTNPARSDLRMFGRGPDERAKRRRRRGGTPRRPKPGAPTTAAKVPQRLLGPTAFPLDRLLAVLGALLEENDSETRLSAPQYRLPGEYTEMELARTALYANIVELSSMRLLVRTSPADSLDRVQTFKCGIGFDLAVKLARSVNIILADLIYEVV